MNRVVCSVFILSLMLAAELVSVQAVERTLVDSNDYVNVSGPHTRCGDYFVLETKKFGEFEAKEIHVVFELENGVATSILYPRDVTVVLDESKPEPVLLMKRENPDLDKDTLRLSQASYDEAKDCLPAPDDEQT